MTETQYQLLSVLKDTAICFYRIEINKKHMERNREEFNDFEKIMTREDIDEVYKEFLKWEKLHCTSSSTKGGQIIDYVSFNANKEDNSNR